VNAWKIEVQGKMNKFEVQDIDNEVHPNPIFGHDAQVYVREELPVLDKLTLAVFRFAKTARGSFSTARGNYQKSRES